MKKIIKGITLVEVVAACALFAMSIGGILIFSFQNIKLSKAGDYFYVANNLAKNRIERIRKIRDEKGISYLSYLEESNVYIDRDGDPDSNGEFVRTTTIDTGYGSNLVKVTVTVNYKMLEVLRPYPVELVTILNEYQGLYEE